MKTGLTDRHGQPDYVGLMPLASISGRVIKNGHMEAPKRKMREREVFLENV